MGSSSLRKPPSFDELFLRSPATVETLRLIIHQPAGAKVSDIERKVGDASTVMRTLHRLQSAGLINIQLERMSHDLVVLIPPISMDRIQGLLSKLS